ncbi:type I-F CRISPR-associated endonuclease Cas1f [Legionella parisiensis]|uniref:type I-F CRISPR-associated endonuclease Cas1f n=1 Tax=Legionella parisiensis TaxID=45071 RepID=UPI0023E3B0E0|nr:type I-F CRISPR-associated endonuclease Cas1f [Legionella parisiensis]
MGTGTSITQAAVRMLAQAGVVIGFCGGGGTPLLMANEVEWFTPQSEYRPTEYMQGWMKFWFDEKKRLFAAKQFQLSRIEYLKNQWEKSRDLAAEGFNYHELQQELLFCEDKIKSATAVNKLMQAEAELTKNLYRYAASRTQYGKFSREREAKDKANIFFKPWELPSLWIRRNDTLGAGNSSWVCRFAW